MKTIVLVDDSKTILMSMGGILGSAGYKAESFEQPQEALARLKNSPPPALILTDLNMPTMNGISLIREIRKLPACRFLPILVLTTESKQEMRTEAKSAGATGWLVKPVTAEALLGILGKLLPG
jgi:two-component system chemotaxis response regulator CheY